MLDYVKSPLLPRMDVEEEDFQFFDKGQQAGAGGHAGSGVAREGQGGAAEGQH